MEFLKKLITKLGLGETATEDQVVDAVAALAAKKEPAKVEVVAKEVLAALDLRDGDSASTVVASIHALKQGTKNMVSREEFEKVRKDLADRDAREVVAKARLAGKVSADQEEWATEYATRDLEGFKLFAAKAPVVVPVNDLPGKKEEAGLVVDDAVLAVAKLMGNTAEDIKQYN